MKNGSENKADGRPKLARAALAFRSRITNGSALAECVDGRSAWARRFRDLLEAYLADLGGGDVLSEGQCALARRAALIQVELEFQETKLALLHEEGRLPSRERIEAYGRNANTLRRLVESLGLHRGRAPRDVTDQVVEAMRGAAP